MRVVSIDGKGCVIASTEGRRTARLLCSIAAFAVLLPAGTAAAAISDDADAGSYVTDGPVHAVAHEPGGNTYIGGDFSHIGPRSGHGVSLTTADPITGSGGDPVWSLGDSAFPEVAGGDVRAVVSDEHGGWFIGGDFTSVGGEEVPRLAHILPSGELDESWRPAPDDSVLALALDRETSASEWTLYAGGNFTQLTSPDIRRNGNRDFLAAWGVSAADGIPTSPGTDELGELDNDDPLDWNPAASADGAVRALAVKTLDIGPDAGPAALRAVVFAGGDFTKMGKNAPAANRLAALWGAGATKLDDTSISGEAVGGGTWNPGPAPPAVNSVRALVAGPPGESATHIYVPVYFGGAFSANPLGVRASRLQLRKSDLTALAGTFPGWTPNVDGTVRALTLSGTTLYLGGDFANVGGQARNSLAAVAAIPDEAVNTANACNPTPCPATRRDWSPNPPDGGANAIAASADGAVVYAGGDFTEIGSGTAQPRAGMAALAGSGQPDEGSALAWDAKAAGGATNALALQGDALYVGGGFFSVGASERRNLAALDPDGGLVEEFDTGTSCAGAGCADEVQALALAPDAKQLYVGGAFSVVGGQPRDHLAALDLEQPQLPPPPGQAPIEPFGEVIPEWEPNPDGRVLTLDVAGETLYVGGAFDHIGEAPEQLARGKLAAIDRDTGQVLDWNPDAERSGPGGAEPFNVYDIEASCETVYVGGSFDAIGAVPAGNTAPDRGSIAELDSDTAAATPWNPNPDSHPGVVRALAIDDDVVYVGGSFSLMGTTPGGGTAARERIAAVRRGDASATSWNPASDGLVQALAVSGDGQTVFAGGEFWNIGDAERWGLAALQADGVGNGLGEATEWDPSAREPDPANGDPTRSEVSALAASGDNAYAGGQFTDIGASAQRGYAQFRGPDSEPASTDPLFCGQPPAPPQPPGPADTAAPGLGHAFITDGGQTLVVNLSEPAGLHVELSGKAAGLKPLGKAAACMPDTSQLRNQLQRALRPKLRKLPARKRARKLKKLIAKRACTIVLPPRAFGADGASGPNRVSLAGAGPLAPGSYRAVITARDGAGNQAQPLTIDFKVGP